MQPGRVLDSRAVTAFESDLACQHSGKMADSKAVLPRLVVEELGGERPVFGRVVGHAANLFQDRIGPQPGEIVVDGGQLLVLGHLPLHGIGPVDFVDRFALGQIVGRWCEPLPHIGERVERIFEPGWGGIEIHAPIGQLTIELRALDAGRVLDQFLGITHPQLRGFVVHGVAVDFHQCTQDVVVVEAGFFGYVVETNQLSSRRSKSRIITVRPFAKRLSNLQENIDTRIFRNT